MFPEFFAQAPTLRLHDPLAAFLGSSDDGCLDFSFTDVARLAGHACPTVGAAFLMTRRALQALYGDQLPVRGDIAVALGAAEEQGTTGVTGLVAGYLTGAAGNGGFAGLAGRFSRRQRLQFGQPLASGLLRFRRLDTGDTVEVGADPRLPADEAAREMALRQALTVPGSVFQLPAVAADAPPAQAVLLWLHDAPGTTSGRPTGTADAADSSASEAGTQTADSAHRAERIEPPAEKHGLLMYFRAESLLAVAEFLRVNRSVDDDPDPHAADAARDLDQLALATPEAGERLASRVRFELDLPSAAADDLPLGPGLPLPEWDYRKGVLLDDHVRLQELVPRDARPQPLPAVLRRTARRLHQQFAALQPARQWLKAQPDGSELDLDAVVRATTDRLCGRHAGEQLFQSLERRQRDLACLVLADLSLSTDAWVSCEARVIDVIRDALLLFGEALRATGDRFALCGFSSVRRQQVRFHRFKDFAAPFDDLARGRIQAIRPGYYTRLGAAIRRASQRLAGEPASRRILLLLSDGKPNDLDLYDSRYGIEDTRMAVREARRAGLLPFCLTIDREGASYLPHLFGNNGYAVLRNPADLPLHLPRLYAQLTTQP